MGTTVKLHLLRVGACRHLECMAARGGRWALMDFPALCGLIQHPTRGWILFDTGYAEHFFTATESFPERFYRIALPIDLPPNECLSAQLAELGLTAADIGAVIISHYHGDHIAGLRDFTQARFIALRKDTQHFMALTGRRWRATLQGYLPGLLPVDFLPRLQLADNCTAVALPAWLHPFTTGFDLLGDGSLIGVPLPGHSSGQMGLFIPDADGRPVFLIGDAAWSLPFLRKGRLPSRLTTMVMAERRTYAQTFMGLHNLALRETAIALLPSHCSIAWQEYLHGI